MFIFDLTLRMFIGFKSGNIKNTVEEVSGGRKHQRFDRADVSVCFSDGHIKKMF